MKLSKEEQEGKAVVFLNRRSILDHTAKREFVESLFEFLRDFDLTVFGIIMERPEKPPYEGIETLPQPPNGLMAPTEHEEPPWKHLKAG
jgi:hypothetical protein